MASGEKTHLWCGDGERQKGRQKNYRWEQVASDSDGGIWIARLEREPLRNGGMPDGRKRQRNTFGSIGRGARNFLFAVNGVRFRVGLGNGVVWQRDQFFPFEGIAEGALQFRNPTSREPGDSFLKVDF